MQRERRNKKVTDQNVFPTFANDKIDIFGTGKKTKYSSIQKGTISNSEIQVASTMDNWTLSISNVKLLAEPSRLMDAMEPFLWNTT